MYLNEHEKKLIKLLDDIKKSPNITQQKLTKILAGMPKEDKRIFRKAELLTLYKNLVRKGKYKSSKEIEANLQTKPIRTQSGVVPVTVLTKPYPCPGQCIFCPTDYRMPKSYLHDEPGAMRAEANHFDPYLQTKNRIKAFEMNGHSSDKIELLVLGGTWSSYDIEYQEWFIKRCFDAMNSVEAVSLEEAHKLNEKSKHRNVGLVLETRPDHITPLEVKRMRRYGATKVQIGIQSLRNEVLDLNHRGEHIEDSKEAIKLLRLAGFKIHAHWMPNLLGANIESDKEDYPKLWEDPALRPDELKIYPCSVLKNAELYEYFLRGEYVAYTEEELVDLLAHVKPMTPRYVRLNRVIRDIPSTNIVTGNTKTNLRQIVHQKMNIMNKRCECIRCREIRGGEILRSDIVSEDIVYDTGYSKEYFLSFRTKSTDKILGFLRLSIPVAFYRKNHFIEELKNSSIIREIHIYGNALKIGEEGGISAQHLGLGEKLIQKARETTARAEISNVAVISAIGTRGYYRKKGFRSGELYMHIRSN